VEYSNGVDARIWIDGRRKGESPMSKITVACAALSGRIYAGRINKAGNSFLDGKQDVTSDVLKAVIDKIKPGFIEIVTVDGTPKYEIEVREILQA